MRVVALVNFFDALFSRSGIKPKYPALTVITAPEIPRPRRAKDAVAQTFVHKRPCSLANRTIRHCVDSNGGQKELPRKSYTSRLIDGSLGLSKAGMYVINNQANDFVIDAVFLQFLSERSNSRRACETLPAAIRTLA